MMFCQKLAISVFSLMLFGSPSLADETKRQHGAHEHGVSKLTLALDQTTLQIEIESPGADIVGFEHPAEDDDERLQIKDALALLAQPFKIFEFPAAAGCSIKSVKANLEADEEETHSNETAKDHEENSDHTAFHVTYSLDCTSPKNLTNIGLGFFKHFPNAEEIEFEAISDNGQIAKEIGNRETAIDLSSIID